MQQQNEEENPEINLIQKLQKEVLLYNFLDTKLKLCIFQSGKRRTEFNYPKQNGKMKNSQLNEDSEMPSLKILEEIKLDRELQKLINIHDMALNIFKEETANLENIKLDDFIKAVIDLNTDNIKLENAEDELKTWQNELEELHFNLRRDRELAEIRIKKQIEQISKLRTSLKNMRQIHELEMDLVIKWEENRLTQVKILGQNAERELKRQIAHYLRLIESEDCAIEGMNKFYEKQFQGYRQKLTEWQIKYATEVKRHDDILREQELKIFELHKLHERQLEAYGHHVEYIKVYMAQKAEEERLLQLELKRLKGVVHIQAWWRGIMVRRGFGPFRKKTKKSKKSKTK